MGHAGSMAIFGRLDVLADDVEPNEWWFDCPTCEIGREPGVHLVVPRDEVSRRHARIERSGVAHFLTDLGSTNGTYVNGRRLKQPLILADCDEIGFGSPGPAVRFREFDANEVAPVRPRYDDATDRFYLGGQLLDLSFEERALLLVLWNRYEEVCPQSECATGIWGADHPPSLERTALLRIIDGLREKVRRIYPDGNPIVAFTDGYRLAG